MTRNDLLDRMNESPVLVTTHSGDRVLVDPEECLVSDTAVIVLKRNERGKLQTLTVPLRAISLVQAVTAVPDAG